MRPTIIFDLNGTLTDPAAIGAPWQSPRLGLAVLRSAIESAMTDALTETYRPFSEHVAAAVGVQVQRHGLDPEHIEDATQAAARLPAFPDARPALEKLLAAEKRLAVLTNSGAASGEQTLEAAGLAGYFDAIIGVDAVDNVKPHRSTYDHALEVLDVSPDDALLVAAHGWDVTGAKRAGLATCWIERGEHHLIGTAPEPDIRAADLLDAARQISA